MTFTRRLRTVSGLLARGLVRVLVVVLILIGIAISVLETGWAKDQIRALIVRQANQYLTARLDIGQLGGSLLRGLRLEDIRLSRDGRTVITIEAVSLSYSLRELLQGGTVIRRILVTRPRVIATREADGRWDLATLIKREARQQERTGPRRPIEIQTVTVTDASVTLSDPVQFGAAHIPTKYESLNATLSFAYVPVQWSLNLAGVSWRGSAPDLSMDRLSGRIENGPGGIVFTRLRIETPKSALTVDGRIARDGQPTTLALDVSARRFAFQEWSGVLRGLRNIAVEAAFDTSLRGPLTRLNTGISLQSDAGIIRGTVMLDTTIPGWKGAGTVTVERIDLAKWLNKPDKPSDISGRLTFDLAFGFGQHFPRGTYAFNGPHAMFMHYEGENVRANGRLVEHAALVTEATATAYGAEVKTVDASIGIEEPFAFHFPGTLAALDLRRLPDTIPVPHVESLMTLDYDATGQFSNPYLAARARFAPSQFIGATIADGTVGTLDTSAHPLAYTGDGEIAGVDMGRFGDALDVRWMRDPRYTGTVSGRFTVEGSGGDRATLSLTGKGRLRRVNMFGGRMADADVTIDIADGTLRSSFVGQFAALDPAVAMADSRYSASLSGTAAVRVTARDLLAPIDTPADVSVEGTATLRSSRVRGIDIDTGHVDGTFAGNAATLRRVDISGPAVEASGSGSLAFTGTVPGGSDFVYDVKRADLERLPQLLPSTVAGQLATKGRLTGVVSHPTLAGEATLSDVKVPDFESPSMSGRYDVTIRSSRFSDAAGRIEVTASFPRVFGRPLQDGSGTATYDDGRFGFDVKLQDAGGRHGSIAGTAQVRPDERVVMFSNLAVTIGSASWRLATTGRPPVLTWYDGGLSIESLAFVNSSASDQHVDVSGTWRRDGAGALKVTAARVVLDTLTGVSQVPARYGGLLDLDATISGTRQRPVVNANVRVAEGRVRRLSFQSLQGRLSYVDQNFDIDMRLDQAPGVWMVAKGKLPLGFFNQSSPEQPIALSITSRSVSLGLLEGLTNVVRNVTGQLQLTIDVVGTSKDPHFEGTVDVADAAFQVTSTGAKYQRGRVDLKLATDRIQIEALHIEDSSGRPLDIHGSLGTHELRVGELAIDGTARRFEVLRNEFGRVDIDAEISLRGRFEAPFLDGMITINNGELLVDSILERTLARPYSTEPLTDVDVDAVAALNPWDRLGLDLSIRIPQNLRLIGQNIQVSPGTPIGLGDVNLRVGGDLYLYKAPRGSLSVTGSLDAIRGTYRFQGRPFEIDEPTSSINFLGDLNPGLYVTVKRVINAVEARVTIMGDLKDPELRLSSTPPLDSSDVLSLIVFGTTTNDLSLPQQQELAVRAGTIAAGFLATPLVSAVERALGLEVLQIEPTGMTGTGPRLTVGQEIAPGLIARFSRQFGADVFDSATLEYVLSRLLRIRATFSDATSLSVRSPFIRIERAGIDLLLFFSF